MEHNTGVAGARTSCLRIRLKVQQKQSSGDDL